VSEFYDEIFGKVEAHLDIGNSYNIQPGYLYACNNDKTFGIKDTCAGGVCKVLLLIMNRGR
jgi:hypothetical protein